MLIHPFAIATGRMLKLGSNGRFSCLRSLGSLLLYSTSVASKYRIKNPPPLVQFLSKSVGFSEEEAASFLTKVSHRLEPTLKQSELVVNFLKNSGFDEAHIRKTLTCHPQLLVCKVETTLKPKFRVFQELGLSGSDLGLFVTQQPQLLKRSLKAHIVPSLEMLKSVIGCNEQLLNMLLKTKSQQLLSSNVLKNLPQNLQLLQSYGVPNERIKLLFKQKPLLLIQSTQWFEKKVRAVEEKLGIPPTSHMFCYGVSGLCSIHEDKLESWIQEFRVFGWNETQISTLLRTNPSTLTMSKEIIRVKLKYFMEELGFGSDYLSTHSVLLKLSMEKRIVPRIYALQALKENQLLKKGESFYSLMSKGESKFVELYLLPFKDILPELYEYYKQQTSSGGYKFIRS
ncbi:hypothetical protein V2J09_009178 [Rumex salicifolius]